MTYKDFCIALAWRSKMDARDRTKKSGVPIGFRHTAETKAKMSANRRGPKSPTWKGGRRMHGAGYVYIWSPDHPYANSTGLVMEAHLGRPLLPTEVVHHINGIRDDNRIENLGLFSSMGKHSGHHLSHEQAVKMALLSPGRKKK
jgi:hypothetical protein